MENNITETSNFEDSLEQLEKIVNELEGGDIPLDRSLELYERGTRLSRQCQERLQKAEERIEALTRDSGVRAVLPLEEEEPVRESVSDLSDDDIPF